MKNMVWSGRSVIQETNKLVFFAFLTNVVNCGDTLHTSEWTVTRGANRKERTPVEGTTVRATISFPSEIYQTLEDMARQKKVSLAWIVREASEQYIADKWPLLAPKKGA